MSGQPQLRKLLEWFDSGRAYALINAYRIHHKTGTTGIESQADPRTSIFTERGVLRSERFEEYMLSLERWVKGEINGNNMEEQTTLGSMTLLETTLSQMIGSVNFEEAREPGTGLPLRELFEEGKQMGATIREYFRAINYRPEMSQNRGRVQG